jgi:hypothetical protein
MAKKQSAEATATTNATTATANSQVIITRIKSVSFIQDSNNYIIEFTNDFDAIVKNGDKYEDGKSNHITFNSRYFKYLVLNAIPDLALIYEHTRELANANDETFVFTAAKLNKYLQNATIHLKRTKFSAGDEYVDQNGEVFTHNNSGYDTEIVKLQLDVKGERRLEKDIDAI